MLASVNGLLARGMDWGDIIRLIELERGRGNPVAEIILECKFTEGKIVLGLREDEEEEDSGDETDEEEETKSNTKGSEMARTVKIEVDLGLSAWSNAREYFDKKKLAAEKVMTPLSPSYNVGITDSTIIFQSSQKPSAKDYSGFKSESQRGKTTHEKSTRNKMVRKVLLVYFFRGISCSWVPFPPPRSHPVTPSLPPFRRNGANCSARDNQQSELLVRKYFRKGDVYVHSDLQNSCVVVIKNPIEEAVIPPGTLSQAGVMTVATSRAWEVKQGILPCTPYPIVQCRLVRTVLMVVTSAWWVPYSQVQRGDAGYEVRGKKNFLPPAMLVLGYGILWTTEDEETMERHARTLLVETETPPEPPYEIEAEEAIEEDAQNDVKEEPTKDDSDWRMLNQTMKEKTV